MMHHLQPTTLSENHPCRVNVSGILQSCHKWFRNYLIRAPVGQAEVRTCLVVRDLLDQMQRRRRKEGRWDKAADIIIFPPVSYPFIVDTYAWVNGSPLFSTAARLLSEKSCAKCVDMRWRPKNPSHPPPQLCIMERRKGGKIGKIKTKQKKPQTPEAQRKRPRSGPRCRPLYLLSVFSASALFSFSPIALPGAGDTRTPYRPFLACHVCVCVRWCLFA